MKPVRLILSALLVMSCKQQPITYHKDVQEGASNEWLEPVTDDIYNSL